MKYTADSPSCSVGWEVVPFALFVWILQSFSLPSSISASFHFNPFSFIFYFFSLPSLGEDVKESTHGSSFTPLPGLACCLLIFYGLKAEGCREAAFRRTKLTGPVRGDLRAEVKSKPVDTSLLAIMSSKLDVFLGCRLNTLWYFPQDTSSWRGFPLWYFIWRQSLRMCWKSKQMLCLCRDTVLTLFFPYLPAILSISFKLLQS